MIVQNSKKLRVFQVGYRQVALSVTSKNESTPYDVNFPFCLFSLVNIGGIYLKENKSREALYLQYVIILFLPLMEFGMQILFSCLCLLYKNRLM